MLPRRYGIFLGYFDCLVFLNQIPHGKGRRVFRFRSGTTHGLAYTDQQHWVAIRRPETTFLPKSTAPHSSTRVLPLSLTMRSLGRSSGAARNNILYQWHTDCTAPILSHPYTHAHTVTHSLYYSRFLFDVCSAKRKSYALRRISHFPDARPKRTLLAVAGSKNFPPVTHTHKPSHVTGTVQIRQ